MVGVVKVDVVGAVAEEEDGATTATVADDLAGVVNGCVGRGRSSTCMYGNEAEP